MSPLLSGMAITLVILITVLVIIVCIYLKHNKSDSDSENSGDNVNTGNHNFNNNIAIGEDEKHDEFIKSIQVINDERTIIGTVVVNGIQQQVSMEQEGDRYVYYLGNEVVGGSGRKGDGTISGTV